MPKKSTRRRSPSRAGRSAAMLATNTAISSSTVRQSAGASRSTSSPLLGLAVAAAEDVDREQHRARPAAARRRASARPRADRVRLARRGVDAGGVDEHDHSDHGQQDGDPSSARRRACPGSASSRSRERRSCQPELASACRRRAGPAAQEVAELVAGHEGVGPAVLLQRVLPAWRGVHLRRRRRPGGHARVGDAGRGHDAAPVGEDQVDARPPSASGRRRPRPLVTAGRQDADVAGL